MIEIETLLSSFKFNNLELVLVMALNLRELLREFALLGMDKKMSTCKVFVDLQKALNS